MVFGSTIPGTRSPESDIDLIVEFSAGHIPGFSFARMGDELSDLFGCPIDLHTPDSLSRYLREEVLREAQLVYSDEE